MKTAKVNSQLGRVFAKGALIGCCSLLSLTGCSSPSGAPADGEGPAAVPLAVTGQASPAAVGSPVAATNPAGAPVGEAPNSSDDIINPGPALPRSVANNEAPLLTTGDDGKPDNSKFPYSYLKQPDLVRLLPEGLSQVGPEAALGLIATPTAKLTAGYAKPTDSGPVMALNQDTDMLLNMSAHWAVVGQQDGWVQILTPVGRGSLPSKDPSQVNHHTLWVKAKDVTIEPAEYRVVVSTEDYTMTVTGPDGSNTFHVGVGKVGKTETPKGLCAIVGRIVIQTGEPGLLTNCQSEMLDYFDGSADAATAIHEYDPLGFDPAVGGAVSNGCIRVPNDSYEKYVADLPAGTPVIIK